MVKIDKRRYKIVGFRDLQNGYVRVILTLCEPVKKIPGPFDPNAIMQNPMGFANQLVANQMNQMVHDTFLITNQEYLVGNYRVGEKLIVKIEKEK